MMMANYAELCSEKIKRPQKWIIEIVPLNDIKKNKCNLKHSGCGTEPSLPCILKWTIFNANFWISPPHLLSTTYI
jgi:hypothetical protein